MINARDFGAVGDGIHDDTAALQAANSAARAASDHVWLPKTSAAYMVSRAGTAYYSLRVTASWYSDGATIRQMPGQAASVSLMDVMGSCITIQGLTLDGNRGGHSIVSEHRHGIFAHDATYLRVVDTTARDFTGDGFYLYNNVTRATLENVDGSYNARNGLTFGASVDGAIVRGSRFVANNKQQVDSEPGGTNIVRNVLIENCRLSYGSASADWALTCSGTADAQGAGWIVRGCWISGGVFMVWVDNVLFAGNEIDNPTPKQAICVQRSCNNVQIVGNRVYQRQLSIVDRAAIMLEGTPGGGPSGVLVAGNEVQVDSPSGFGVRADGIVTADIVRNTFVGGACSMRVRTTIPERPIERVALLGNTCGGYGRAPLEVYGSGTAKILALEARRNTFIEANKTPTIAPDVIVQSVVDP